jgi:hypothetical protein
MLFFFEIYTKTNGIEVGFVRDAESRDAARDAVRDHYESEFDEFIQCYETNEFTITCPHAVIYA